jgi:hypothetical protein
MSQPAEIKQAWYTQFLSPQIVFGMLSLVFTGGILYAEIKGIKADTEALNGRYQRQFELMNRLGLR